MNRDASPDDEPEPLHYTGFLIRRAQQAHVAAWQRLVSPSVSSVQFGVLAVLDRRPGASQQDLRDELDLDPSTITDLVRRLQANGLIERRRDPLDRRRNRTTLSPRGADELRELRRRAERVEHALTDALDADRRRQLRELLLQVLGSARERLADVSADQPPLPGTGGSSMTSPRIE